MSTHLYSENICFRALDHKHERSDRKIISHLISHLENGVLSRRERYGEIYGRIGSGMLRQPQGDIYVASPLDYPGTITDIDIVDFLNWFDREHESAHRVYLIIRAPQTIDHYKQRQHIIHDSTPKSEREIRGVIVRVKFIKEMTLGKIEEITGKSGLPVFKI